jgi:hypothetical protein
MLALLLAAHLYTVKPGDTLFGIVGNNWPAVCDQNHLENCNLIYPGEVLNVQQGAATVSYSVASSDSDNGVSDRVSHYQSSPSGSLSCSGLESLWMAAGGNYGVAFIAAEIAMAESGGNQYATGPNGERGYWQINPDHGYLATYDAYGNARAAISISSNGADWSAWTTYTSGAYIGRCLYGVNGADRLMGHSVSGLCRNHGRDYSQSMF